ncbi:uncharacterized protein Z520_10878 [Fonsecaea multimorphosa CBS 102226]|uniref:MmgE/PrpD family protein n=1 Tax=Fonsecaea multimorphosa CBS 102226 TaxID=1442371 RepID=A0A0D2KAK0_9EURO|nr:uncharacterized protein Z520_10878 [Fonsecaea multimorphosa CBS 102226]KIX93458.1 hypothetical protein Z520_10878 [Fonsecaea multimorphosa CBS 102226]OAL18755.1 hypothetical protein AYO22_10449 [Fonsecaea multimorphosa]
MGDKIVSNTLTSSSIPPPATEILAKFVHDAKYEDLDKDDISVLKDLLLDYIGVAAAAVEKAESTEPVFQAVLELDASSNGQGGLYTVFTKGRRYCAQSAALLNAFLGHSLDFDDTYSEGSVHPGVTAITAGLVAADGMSLRETRVDIAGKPFLTAVAVGYEVTCRLSRAVGQGSYARGFHNTSITGIFGAIATIAKLKSLEAGVVEMAFGLAGSKAAGSMQYLENGSWNKRLHPGFAVRDAFLCLALAEKGVLGASKILEGKFGFFHMYAISGSDRRIDYAKLLGNLGSEWIFLATLTKPYPACRMTHGLIEMVDRLRTKVLSKDLSSSPNDPFPSQTIEQIRIKMPAYQIPVVGASQENKIHPQNVVDAQFSAYYQVALTWLHGARTGWAGYDYLDDADMHSLADRITITSDETLSRFQQTITLEFTDGSKLEDTIRPHASPREEARTPEYHSKVIGKFISLAESVYGIEKAAKIQEVVENLESHCIVELLDLLQ